MAKRPAGFTIYPKENNRNLKATLEKIAKQNETSLNGLVQSVLKAYIREQQRKMQEARKK